MKAFSVVLLVSLSTPAMADCSPWSNDGGDRLSLIDDFDWEYLYERQDTAPARCITLRNPERTVLACEDGSEAEIFLGSLTTAGLDADLMSFDYKIWFRTCD
jgi:hypothetical protein